MGQLLRKVILSQRRLTSLMKVTGPGTQSSSWNMTITKGTHKELGYKDVCGGTYNRRNLKFFNKIGGIHHAAVTHYHIKC